MYGEFFDIPVPDELVLISWFAGGEVFRSGCTFRRGKGKIFYFRPGHETHPIYYQTEVQQILAQAACWAMPGPGVFSVKARNVREPLEPLSRAPSQKVS
jgi:trehalose utilization protein